MKSGKKVVGMAQKGKGPKAQHTHPVTMSKKAAMPGKKENKSKKY